MNVPNSIFGFSSSNIFVDTAGGGIWKFDGTKWQQIMVNPFSWTGFSLI